MRFKIPEVVYIIAKKRADAEEVGQRFGMRKDDWVYVNKFERIQSLSRDIRVFLVEWPSDEFEQHFKLRGISVERYL